MQNINFNTKYSAQNYMHNYVVTTDEQLKKTKEYETVSNIIFNLMQGGIIHLGKGYCISLSDMIYTILKQNNIPCKIVECQLTLSNKQENKVEMVGFDSFAGRDITKGHDTHVVVVTETEHPMIIDMSISHMLPNNIQGVIDSVKKEDNRVIAHIVTENVLLTYQEKKVNTIPVLHQKSIIDRIQTDLTLFSSIKKLKFLIFLAIFISLLNASRGFYDFYMVYFEQNDWGPTAIQKINQKLDILLNRN